MKKFFLSFLIICGFTIYSQTAANVFSSDSMVYYGIDFSNCRLIGDFGNGSGADMKNKMFIQWNEIFIKEAAKYDLGHTFRKKLVYYDMHPVALQNSKTEENLIRTHSEYTLDPSLIPAMVSRYVSGEKKNGLGLVFIVDNYDKNRNRALVYVTFFDIATKKLFFSEEMKGDPGGIGLRNYWSRALFLILKDIEDTYYDKWRNQFDSN